LAVFGRRNFDTIGAFCRRRLWPRFRHASTGRLSPYSNAVPGYLQSLSATRIHSTLLINITRRERALTRHWHSGLCTHLFSVRSGCHGCAPFSMGPHIGRSHRGRQDLHQLASGFGDPMTRIQYQCHRPPAQKDIPASVMALPSRVFYRPACDLAVPIGEYDSSQPLKYRSKPLVWALWRAHHTSDWPVGAGPAHDLGIFARRVVLSETNDDYVGQTIETIPCSSWTRTLTRDSHRETMGVRSMPPGTTVARRPSTMSRERSSTTSFGITLGYQINKQPELTVATSRPLTTAPPMTFVWILSWFHWV